MGDSFWSTGPHARICEGWASIHWYCIMLFSQQMFEAAFKQLSRTVQWYIGYDCEAARASTLKHQASWEQSRVQMFSNRIIGLSVLKGEWHFSCDHHVKDDQFGAVTDRSTQIDRIDEYVLDVQERKFVQFYDKMKIIVTCSPISHIWPNYILLSLSLSWPAVCRPVITFFQCIRLPRYDRNRMINVRLKALADNCQFNLAHGAELK